MPGDGLARLLHEQDGVVARRQLLGDGLSRVEVARLVRRGELTPLHAGVYVEHHGPPTWRQRAWAGVLHAWPAALCHDSALRVVEGPGRRGREEGVIHVAVAHDRHLATVDGVRLHRVAGFPGRVQWSPGPPRIRYGEALLDVAAAAEDDLAAIGVLAEAGGARRTTAARLLGRLDDRARPGRRAWLVGVLRDAADGTCTVLEHGYLERVVRPHGLPEGTRQVSAAGLDGRVCRDVVLSGPGVVVELDAAQHHTAYDDRCRDLHRDLEAAAESSLLTVRLGWRQVFGTPCRTAAQLDRVLRRRGWGGRALSCTECGGSDRPRTSEPPHSASYAAG